MNVYILTDLEGVASFKDDTRGNARFYLKARALLTEEVNAAVRGCLQAGATEVVVWDGHGPGGVNPESLHEEAKLILGSEEPPNLALDRGWDALMFIGQHAMSLTPKGNLAHSYSSRVVREMRLNGCPIGEFGIRSYLAGCFGVPVVLLTGDEAACAEARALVPGIETVAVKEGLSLNCALSLSPGRARALIEAAASRALTGANVIQPLRLTPPFELTIEYVSPEVAQGAHRHGWERLGETTFRNVTDDFLEVAM